MTRTKTTSGGSIHNWASEAADHIVDEVSENVQWRNRRLVTPSVERIAAIIATFAEPLITLLNESRRAHRHDGLYGKTCCPRCTCHSEDDEESEANDPTHGCNCEAGAWNEKIDSVLAGNTVKNALRSGRRDDRPVAKG